ncbi:MAG: adenosylcobinamide amidohydrolase [Candidatus Freyarchaeota archaeon]|nr:adenosylcobinamide amidohydrolase [Candidatus Jordarchaeia archaeon]
MSFPDEKSVLVTFPSECRAISSAVLEPGITKIDGVLILQVPVDYSSDAPEEDLRRAVETLKLKGRLAGLMTAANVGKVFTVKRLSSDGLVVTVAVTAGTSNALVAGEAVAGDAPRVAGTINVVVFVNKALTDGGLVNAVITVTEAKCLALRVLGFNAGGTSTDAVIVACPDGGEEKLRYTGPATRVGALISRAVRDAVTESILKAREAGSRNFLDWLRERGVTLEDMAEAALALHAPHSEMSAEEVERRFIEEVKRLTCDVNLNALISSAIHLEELGLSGRIHGLSADEFKGDPVHLLADEIIGMAIAEYIAGTRGVFNYVRYDREKPGVISSLGPFLDDVAASLIGGVMSKVYSER